MSLNFEALHVTIFFYHVCFLHINRQIVNLFVFVRTTISSLMLDSRGDVCTSPCILVPSSALVSPLTNIIAFPFQICPFLLPWFSRTSLHYCTPSTLEPLALTLPFQLTFFIWGKLTESITHVLCSSFLLVRRALLSALIHGPYPFEL